MVSSALATLQDELEEDQPHIVLHDPILSRSAYRLLMRTRTRRGLNYISPCDISLNAHACVWTATTCRQISAEDSIIVEASWVCSGEQQRDPGAHSVLVPNSNSWLVRIAYRVQLFPSSRVGVSSSDLMSETLTANTLMIFSTNNTYDPFSWGATGYNGMQRTYSENQGIINMHRPPLVAFSALQRQLHVMASMRPAVLGSPFAVTVMRELCVSIPRQLLLSIMEETVIRQATYNLLENDIPRFMGGEMKFDEVTILMVNKAPLMDYVLERQRMCSEIDTTNGHYVYNSQVAMYTAMDGNSCLCFAQGTSRWPPPETPTLLLSSLEILLQPLQLPP